MKVAVGDVAEREGVAEPLDFRIVRGEGVPLARTAAALEYDRLKPEWPVRFVRDVVSDLGGFAPRRIYVRLRPACSEEVDFPFGEDG